MNETNCRRRGGLSDRAAESGIFAATLALSILLIFAGAYAYTNGVEVEVAPIGDLDIIGAGGAAAGFLLFGFSFVAGLRRLAALDWGNASKAALIVVYCFLLTALAGWAWSMGAG